MSGEPAPTPAPSPAPAAPAPAPTPAPAADWRAALPAELQGHEGLKTFKDVPDLAKSWVNAQGVISSRGTVVPKPDAPPEEWSKYYEAIGRPKDAQGYTFAEIKDRPWTEGDKAFQGAFAPVAHEAGLTQAQVDKLASFWNGIVGQQEGNSAKALTEATAQLKADWADKFDANIDAANRALKSVAQEAGLDVEAFRQIRLMDGSFLGDNPMMVRVFAAVGGQLGETPFNGGPPGPGRGDPFASPAAAKAEIDRLYGEDFQKSDHPYKNRRHPQHKWWTERVMKLEALANQVPARK